LAIAVRAARALLRVRVVFGFACPCRLTAGSPVRFHAPAHPSTVRHLTALLATVLPVVVRAEDVPTAVPAH
jgi:hypothetical protein